MKISVITIIFILTVGPVSAQNRDFLNRWFLGFPVPDKISFLNEYGIKNTHFQKIQVVVDTSSLFLLDSTNWAKGVPKDHPIHSGEIDSAVIEIASSNRPITEPGHPELHYSGPTTVVTIEYFLRSDDAITSWVDRLTREALRSKHLSVDVGTEAGSKVYSFGDILFADSQRRYRAFEIYSNVYAKGTTSLLISFEFER